MSDEISPASTSSDNLRPSPRELAIAEELARLDPHLAGMFLEGSRLKAGVSRPGVPFMLGHIIREVTNTVVRHLATEARPTATPEELEELETDPCPTCGRPRRSETNRANIAKVLGASANHPSVDLWYRFQRELHALDHFHFGGADSANVLRAFEDMEAFLFMRLGGYIDTRRELDQLLSKAEPAEGDVGHLAKLMLRPAHRNYFFRELSHPGWIRPLVKARLLPNAPAVQRTREGFRGVPWPEGEFLKRAAAIDPAGATAALLLVPTTLDNPFGWRLVAEVALATPPAERLHLGQHLLEAQRNPGFQGFLFNDKVVEVIARLAEDGELNAAVALTKELLQVRQASQQSKRSRSDTASLRMPSLFAKLSRPYDFTSFLERALPALLAADPLRTAKVLLRRLKSAIITAREEGYDDGSSHWIVRLDEAPRHYEDDARTLLAHATTVAAVHAAARDRESLTALLSDLAESDFSDVAERIRILVLAKSPYVQEEEASAFVSSACAVAPPFRAAEVSRAVRALFPRASTAGKAEFVRRVEAGPLWDEANEGALNRWRRERLRWFHDRLPSELEPLATVLNVVPSVPEQQQRDLDETGFYIGPGTWGDETITPKTAAELAEMAPIQIAELLEEWQQRAASAVRWPFRSGLDDALTEFAASNKSAAVAALETMNERDALWGSHFGAILAGLRKNLDPTIAHDAVRAAALTLRRTQESSTQTGSDERRTFRWAASEAVDLIAEACSRNHIEPSSFPLMWAALDSATRNCLVGAVDNDDNDQTVDDLDRLFSFALNHHSGRVTRAAIEAGLRQYRASRNPDDTAIDSAATAAVASTLTPLLDRLLSSGGETRVAVLTTLGEHIPYIHLLAREWLLANQALVFQTTASPTGMLRPGWLGYVVHSHLFAGVFRDFRHWYTIALDNPTPTVAREASHRHSATTSLGFHVVGAFLSAYIDFDEPDRLLERTFEALSIDDRNRIYYDLGNNYAPSHPDRVNRLLALWRWRVEGLERSNDPRAGEEYHGLADMIANGSIPADDAMNLGLRCLTGSQGHVRNETGIWRMLENWSGVEPERTYPLVALVVRGSLTEDWPLLTFDMVAPTLRSCLRARDEEVVSKCRRLIQDVGERGYEEFAGLLEGED